MRIETFSNTRSTCGPIEMGTRDITDHWDQFLRELFDVGTALKVPGRKAKCKLTVVLFALNLHKNENL